jgi:hypothetical protein
MESDRAVEDELEALRRSIENRGSRLRDDENTSK